VRAEELPDGPPPPTAPPPTAAAAAASQDADIDGDLIPDKDSAVTRACPPAPLANTDVTVAKEYAKFDFQVRIYALKSDLSRGVQLSSAPDFLKIFRTAR